jgi:hypothetical protein
LFFFVLKFYFYLKERKKREEEKQEALRKYKKSKKSRFRNLCQKSKSGQSLMSKQVESLLEKIEKNNKK